VDYVPLQSENPDSKAKTKSVKSAKSAPKKEKLVIPKPNNDNKESLTS